MVEVIQAAAELQAVCQAHGWQFCFIGGVALQRWGEPRETVDADLISTTRFAFDGKALAEVIATIASKKLE